MNHIRAVSLSILLVFLLSACSGSQPSASPPPANPAEAQPAQAATRQPGCTMVSRKPTPGPTEEALLPPPGEKDWIRGAQDASITFIEYSDFQCPYCNMLTDVLEELLQEYPDDLRLVFRHFPLDGHDKAALAVQSAEAAGLQGKFWEMHDLLFEQVKEWNELLPEEFPDWATQQATALGLDTARFRRDMESQALEKLAKDSWERNSAIGMPGTPFLLINGAPYGGRLNYESLDAIIQVTLLEKRMFSDCPPMTIDPNKTYIATVNTKKGAVMIELFADKAPLAVNNFIFLARQGWFDGVTFHRVIPGFVAQAGDPSGTGFGGPGYAFDNEIDPSLVFDGAGIVAMANAGPGSNGSQFFITYAATPNLNGGYTIFGKVIEGMEVVLKLTPRDPSKSMTLPPGDKILSVVIEEKAAE